MNIDKFTIKMKEALQGAENLASRNNNAQIDNEHIFLAVLQNAEEKGEHVYISGVNDNVRSIFAITGFSNIFEFK